MADITFDCPHCQKPIQCDDQWGGQQIQCPLCQGALMVPQSASAPAPAAAPTKSSWGKQLVDVPGSTKLAFQSNAQKPAAVKGNIPIRNLAPEAARRKSPIVKILTWVVVLAGLGVSGYYGWTLWQEKANAKAAEEAKKPDSGQAGQNAGGNQAPGAPGQRDGAGATAIPGATNGMPAAAPAGSLPLVPPVYTLDVSGAKIPEGTVNGVISGSNFVAELTRVDGVGPAQVLRLTQGTPPVAEREILVYLRLKPGDKLSGHTWSIAPEMKGTDVPQVWKQWKVKEGYAPARKLYSTGYAMKLELGQLADGAIPGKIYVALPDNEQSVAAGVFKATTALADVIGAAAPVAGAVPPAGVAPVPGAPPPPPGASSAFDKRYGTSPRRK